MPSPDRPEAAQLPGLPVGIRSGFVDGVNGLRMHVLEAGFEPAGRPRLLLLHGFPELAYSWRKLMLPLAEAGYHVIAPDQRGYGLTTGWDARWPDDPGQFRLFNLATDAVALLHAMGYRSVHALVGHDFGSPLAGFCALIRPDIFPRLVLMSAPFPGAPALPFNTRGSAPIPAGAAPHELLDRALAALPAPRKHYQYYYSGEHANADMLGAPQGLHDFLRAYYHSKSADRPDNQPFPLAGFSAGELARMPDYYIMQRGADMAETVAGYMPDSAEAAHCEWLTDEELAVYCENFTRTGFQGGLNWYRCVTDPRHMADLRIFSGARVTVPACYMAGVADWGMYQSPGALEQMQKTIPGLADPIRVEGAGHWLQQEQPGRVTELLLEFLERTAS